MNPKKLKGLIAAPHTPFTKKGRVNLDLIPAQADLLIRQKVIGAYICGTTGEGVSCSVAERKAVMRAWAKANNGRLFLIAHVGALSLADAQELAAYAQKIGLDATSVVPPNFFRPDSLESLIAFLQAVTSRAPDLPFYYYHTGMSGVTLPMPKFLEAADGRIPNLAGIKFNFPDLYMFQQCLAACGGKYDITWGIDEWLAGAVALGARSAIGSTYNYAAPLYYRIWRAVEKGDLASAQAGMLKVCAIVDTLVRYGGVAAGKAMMAAHGLDLGDPRLPLTALTARQKDECVLRLETIGGFR